MALRKTSTFSSSSITALASTVESGNRLKVGIQKVFVMKSAASVESVLLALLVLRLSCGRVFSNGLGDQHLWTYDTAEAQTGDESDAAFAEPNRKNVAALESDLEKALRSKKIDVVAPGKQLRETMNMFSTKIRAMFFEKYEHYFEDLGVGSTSRPMLYSYIGLRDASDEQIASWYKPSSIKSRQVVESCKKLFDYRRSKVHLNEAESELLEKTKTALNNKLQLGHLVFRNNLNLFMLDAFLLLCNRIESAHLEADFTSLKLTI